MILPQSVDTPIVPGASLHLYGCNSDKNNFLLYYLNLFKLLQFAALVYIFTAVIRITKNSNDFTTSYNCYKITADLPGYNSLVR